jgi:hypothetical protein
MAGSQQGSEKSAYTMQRTTSFASMSSRSSSSSCDSQKPSKRPRVVPETISTPDYTKAYVSDRLCQSPLEKVTFETTADHAGADDENDALQILMFAL